MKKVVVIGGSFGAHLAVSTLYKNSSDIEVTMVSMSSHSFFNIASPRLLVKPDRIGDVFFSIADFMAKTSNGKGNFIHGKATNVDLASQIITVATDGSEKTISYDLLVIATGTKSHFAGFKVNESHLEAKSALQVTAKKLESANLVAVIGGGPAGVETVGEIAYAYKSAQITLFAGNSGPLAAVPRLVDGGTSKLKELGVEVVSKVHVKSVKDGTIVLTNGKTFTFDVIIDASTLTPYSEFLPDSIKDEKGFVVTDKHLVVKGTSNVLAIGDIVSGGSRSIADMKLGQVGVFAASAQSILNATNSLTKEWVASKLTILVPISPSGGEGLIFGWHIPNFLVRMLKANTYMMEKAGDILS